MRRWSTTEASDRVVANPWHDIKHGTVYRVEREAKRERGSTYTYVGLCNCDSILERARIQARARSKVNRWVLADSSERVASCLHGKRVERVISKPSRGERRMVFETRSAGNAFKHGNYCVDGVSRGDVTRRK